MAKFRFRIPNIESFTPAIDARNSDSTFVLDGRNYVFDSKGLKSGFATRLVSDNTSIEFENGVVQGISIAGRTFVCTSKGVYELEKDKQFPTWLNRLNLTAYDQVPFLSDKKWTSVYLSNGAYMCHPDYGFYKLSATVLNQLDDSDVPGLPYRAIAIAETNGRLVVLNSTHVSWSGPTEAENFTPELGGAGQQLLSDYVSGKPLTVAGFQNGFLAWTDKDCLLGEFIGGDNVFRFSRVSTDQIPLSANCVENLPDGSQMICTKQGLHVISNGRDPEKIAPQFNEFLRDILLREPGLTVRINYMMEQDRVYLQLRDWTNHYVRTYVLAVALDKWGVFSERHLGIIRYAPKRNDFGYCDQAGVVHRFEEEAFDKEVTPHVFEPLDSEITIGYVKPPELHGEIDSLLEMQEINIGGLSRPSWSQPVVIDMGGIPDVPCESEDDLPSLIIASALSDEQMTRNYESSFGTITPENWWEQDLATAYAIDYDSGEMYTFAVDVGDYTAPDYYAGDTVYLQRVSSADRAFESSHFPGTFGGRTAYIAWDDGVWVDRHDGDVWSITDMWVENGGTLTRAVKVNNFQFQAAQLWTIWGSFDPENDDTGLGEIGKVVGFTENNIILHHEVVGNRDFKLETLNKNTLTRVSQAYIGPGVGGINGPIEIGDYFGQKNFVMGPDGFLYFVTNDNVVFSPTAFANGTTAILHRYNPLTGEYTDITPWSSSNLPIDHPLVTPTNFGMKHSFYCRATNRYVIIWSVYPAAGVIPLDQFNRAGLYFISAMSFDDYTWEHLGQMPQTLYFDVNGVATSTINDPDTAFFVNGLGVINVRQNIDALPLGSPCMNYLRTAEYMYRVVDGTVVIGDYTDGSKSGIRITVRDPAQNYAVIESFWDADGRYADLLTEMGGTQWLKTYMFGSPFWSTAWLEPFDTSFPRVDYLPTREYMWRSSLSTLKTYSYNNQEPYGPTWNFESNWNYQFMTL